MCPGHSPDNIIYIVMKHDHNDWDTYAVVAYKSKADAIQWIANAGKGNWCYGIESVELRDVKLI